MRLRGWIPSQMISLWRSSFTIRSVSKRFRALSIKEVLWSRLWYDFLQTRYIASINEQHRLLIFNIPRNPQSCIRFAPGEDFMKKDTRTRIIEINEQMKNHKPSTRKIFDCL
eukprot:TRINITY_DN4635_c0_g1_i1.p1 TRINITY_DN4635_c0_g1~~TRINITY_DN4635_c0_g1_i1.p1  ORF type:complete len:112 (+),score=10.41 TRINITY_DN4635_c0_g1_i1:51-386(+)